jgi:hypothetical protein
MPSRIGVMKRSGIARPISLFLEHVARARLARIHVNANAAVLGSPGHLTDVPAVAVRRP